MADRNEVVALDDRKVRKVIYAIIPIMVLAFLVGFPAYLVLGQGGNSQNVTITVRAQPVYNPPTGGGGWGGTVPPVPAAFGCSSLSISPTEVNIGETVNITVLVTNTGGQSGNYLVVLKIKGVIAAEKNIILAAGASEYVSFTTAKDAAGTYSVDVNGLIGTFVVVACPAGQVSTAGRITADGSVIRAFVVESFDKRFSLILHEGTIALNRQGVCFACIGINGLLEPPPPPEGTHVISIMYDVTPDGSTFTPRATLKYNYDSNDIPEGMAEESLFIACYDGTTDKWINLDSVVDTEVNIITAKISQFNDLAVLGHKVEAPIPAEPTPAKPAWWLIGGIIAAAAMIAFVIFLVRKMAHKPGKT